MTKIALKKYEEYILTVDRQTLEQLAINVAFSLYGNAYAEEEKGTDAELDALGLNDGEAYIDSEKEWEVETGSGGAVGTVEDVADDLENAGLLPSQVAERVRP